jgi:UDP-N-acetylmuramoyl-tripeptide--D-alanyl-D-alanine ligase
MKSFFKKIIVKILIWESKAILKKYKPSIIAVTGTVGKTSTKDAIYTVVSSSEYVRKSEKSFNSEIGVPLTIIGCPNGWSDPFAWISNIFQGLELILFKSEYPKCLILEIGADHPGDIESISKWLKIDVSVITKIGDVPVHVEFFPSPAHVVREKSFLIKALKPEGSLVLYVDDKKVSALAQNVKQTVYSFGINEMATINGSNASIIYDDMRLPSGISFRLNYKGNSIPMKINGVLGMQQIYPIIAAATVGIVRNISMNKIVDSFEKHVYPKGRMNIVAGINRSAIIDDSYNSSPDALREALNTLASLQVSGKRIAVIGDMMELGNYSTEEHRKAGVQALQSSDLLVTVGQRARQMATGNSISFDTSTEAGEYLRGIVSEGDVILVKGSQSMRMERVTKAIMLESDNAAKYIVRQEAEWLAKK